MTTFDLEALNPGAWFDYETNGNGEPTSRVKVRAHTQGLVEAVKKECSNVIIEYKQPFKHGPLQPVERRETDDDKMKRLLWDYVVVDWDGFKTPDGEAIECTTDNKVALMAESPEFFAFVDDKVDVLSSAFEKRRADAEKN